jgi:CBS domain-containing protein
MSLERFCRKDLVTIKPEDPVQLAADLMTERHVGSVVVVNVEGRPLGMLTDRDLVCRVMAMRKDPARTLVRDVMSSSAAVIRKDELIDEALIQMRQLGARRLPIVDGAGAAVGMVSLDDLVVMLSTELGQTAAVIRSNRGP